MSDIITHPAYYNGKQINNISTTQMNYKAYYHDMILFGAKCGGENIPYTQLEYIWNSGDTSSVYCCIPLDFNQTTDTVIQIKFNYTTFAGTSLIGATNTTSDSSDCRLFNYDNNIYYDVKSQRIMASSNTNVIHNYEFGNYYVKDLDTESNLITGSSYTISNEYKMALFAGDYQHLYSGDKAKIYYIKVYQGGELVKDFIPVLYNDKCGLWDLIEDKFYDNTGSGTMYGE